MPSSATADKHPGVKIPECDHLAALGNLTLLGQSDEPFIQGSDAQIIS